jgi:hypothetical protein
MWLLLALTHVASADPLDALAGSRWLMEVEETTPVPVELNADYNKTFRTRAMQLAAVLSCPSVRRISKKKADLECVYEDIQLIATPRFSSPTPALIEAHDAVLRDLDDTLTGSRVVLTMHVDGRILAVDLPDAQGGNRRQNEIRENLRRLTADVVVGLHLQRSDPVAESWVEKNSQLVHPPAVGISRSVNRLEHTVAKVDGQTVVQTKGDGTFTTPFVPLEFQYSGKIGTTTTQDRQLEGSGAFSGGGGMARTGGGGTMAGGRTVDAAGQPDATTPTDFIFRADLTSVAVLDEHGIPVERVWALLGAPSASSVGNFMGASLWYAGRQRRLGPDEEVTLGDSHVVAPPGTTWEGVPSWTPIEAM